MRPRIDNSINLQHVQGLKYQALWAILNFAKASSQHMCLTDND